MDAIVGAPARTLSLKGSKTLSPAPAGPVRLAWREARPVVQCMFQLRFLAAASLAAAAHGAPRPAVLAAGSAAWLCTTWNVYLFNGLADQVEDRANRSGRPLASGRLDPAAARRTLGWLAAAALLLALAVGPVLAALVAVMLGLGWCYSGGRRPGKTTALGSSAVIAAGGAVTFLAGWYTGGGRVPDRSFAVVATSMSLWMAVAGLTKDLPDLAGDRLAGRRTLPVLLGARRARALLAVLCLLLGLGTVLAAWRTGAQLPFAGALMAGAVLVAGALSLGGSAHPRRPYRCFMVVQYALHVGLIAGLAIVTGA